MQMHKKQSLFGKEKFMVTVNPNIDYAFIAAVIVILCEINYSDRQSGPSADSSIAANNVVAAAL